MTEDNEVEPP